jgi:hypothetical protein
MNHEQQKIIDYLRDRADLRPLRMKPFHLHSPLDSREPVVLVWRRVWEEDRAMEQQTRMSAQTAMDTK